VSGVRTKESVGFLENDARWRQDEARGWKLAAGGWSGNNKHGHGNTVGENSAAGAGQGAGWRQAAGVLGPDPGALGRDVCIASSSPAVSPSAVNPASTLEVLCVASLLVPLAFLSIVERADVLAAVVWVALHGARSCALGCATAAFWDRFKFVRGEFLVEAAALLAVESPMILANSDPSV
jgi:hypothetical protein